MAWKDDLKGDSLSWLLEKDDIDVRYLAMRDLEDRPHGDRELGAARTAAHKKGGIAAVLAHMDETGFWVKPGPGYSPKYRSTVWSILLLAQLGASAGSDRRIAKACGYLLDHALTDQGQFTHTGAPSGTIDCLQGNLLWALQELGYEDPRLATAYDWMARSVTGDGIAPAGDREAEWRYFAHKCGPGFACGPNNKKPCAWGAVKVMSALGNLPPSRRTPVLRAAIQQGVDFLLSVDPAEARYPTPTGAKPNRDWWKFGFPVFYITDLLQLVEVLANLGYGNDPRLSHAVSLIQAKQDSDGRWPLEFDYKGKTWLDCGAKKKPNKWVTLRALKVLKRIHRK